MSLKMTEFLRRAKLLFALVQRLEVGSLLTQLSKRIYSNDRSICVRRDLSIRFESPGAKIPVSLRPFEPDDIERIFRRGEFDPPASFGLAKRKALAEKQVPGCWVAVTDGDRPCYSQWIFSADRNDLVWSYWGKAVPALKQDEALLEFAYTMEEFRGNGIMSHAMSEIATKCEPLGARFVYSFIGEGNAASLRGSEKAGFLPHTVREQKWRFFRCRYEFTEIAAR